MIYTMNRCAQIAKSFWQNNYHQPMWHLKIILIWFTFHLDILRWVFFSLRKTDFYLLHISIVEYKKWDGYRIWMSTWTRRMLWKHLAVVCVRCVGRRSRQKSWLCFVSNAWRCRFIWQKCKPHNFSYHQFEWIKRF